MNSHCDGRREGTRPRPAAKQPSHCVRTVLLRLVLMLEKLRNVLKIQLGHKIHNGPFSPGSAPRVRRPTAVLPSTGPHFTARFSRVHREFRVSRLRYPPVFLRCRPRGCPISVHARHRVAVVAVYEHALVCMQRGTKTLLSASGSHVFGAGEAAPAMDDELVRSVGLAVVTIARPGATLALRRRRTVEVLLLLAERGIRSEPRCVN